MTEQLALSFEAPLFTLGACSFGPYVDGWAGPHHCERCAAHVEELAEQFAADVARGKYDAQGYTPAERQAQRRRKAER